ncbi:MAG: efflux RND transporter permease subunit [Alistipes sp.]|nr:efflux RND transporter permease subunit [Alistipes sp.]
MSIAQFSMRHRSVVWFLLALCIVGGVWAFLQMGKKEDSTFVLKSAVVSCSYPGATPFEVEELISEPLARELQSMRRVKKISSESYYGLSKITIELESSIRSKQIPQMWDELRRKVQNFSSQLPSGAGPVMVNDDFSDVYGLYFALSADDGFSWSEIRNWAQRIKTHIVTLEGVQKVAVYGEQRPVVNVYVTKSMLSNFSITPDMIVSMMSQQNAVVNTGALSAGDMTLRVLEMGGYSSVEDIANQLLIAPDGKQFRLGDIARIELGYQTPPQLIMNVDGKRAVGIGISTEESADVVKIGQQVREEFKQLQSAMPLGLELVELYPEDKIARQANLSFMLNLLESVLIVIAIIMLAMGLRSGALIGLSLIFTIGGTMVVMYSLGEGINRTSLAGFIIAMGMLVDNAIVVVDNALKSMRQGVAVNRALIVGADAPRWGLFGATLIAIFSFLPLYLAPSSVAEIVKPLFVVIAISLLLSWVLAMSQVPMFGEKMLRLPKNYGGRGGYEWFDKMLRWSLNNRLSVVLLAVWLFIFSLVVMKLMPQNFFPQLDKPYFRADVILPEGRDIAYTQQNLKQMSDWLMHQKEVVKVSSTAGATPMRYYLASSNFSSRPNYGNLLVEVKKRRHSNEVRRRFDKFVADSCPDVWLRSSLFKLSPVPDATIEIGFIGPNVDTLLKLTRQVERIMWNNPNATNVRNSWGNRIPTWLPIYSQIKGQRIGVSRSRMAEWITLATEGLPMTQYRRGDEFIPVLLKDDNIDNYNLSSLSSIPIFSQSGKVYPIEQASSRFDFDFLSSVVKRYNRQRVMKAQCDPIDGANATRLYNEILMAAQARVDLPEGYTMKVFGEQESQQESNRALGEKMPLAIVLIFVVLLMLFGNYRDSLIILLMTPMIFVGVVAGLFVTGNSFDFFSLLGMIGLVGMNIKNAVILVSSINQLREMGADPYEAVVEAARSRLLPVCMASGTTILALIPLLFDSLFAGMASTIMGGLLVATLLTMVLLPVVYAIFYNIKPQK